MFTIITGGCLSKHSNAFIMSRPEGFPHYVILIVHTSGEFQIGTRSFSIHPGHAVIIAPGTPYHYGNPMGEYIDDWIHFDVSDDSWFRRTYPITNELFPLGNTDIPSYLIRQLLWEKNYAPQQYLQQNTDSLLSVLLNHLSTDYSRTENNITSIPFQSQLQAIRLELQYSITKKHCISDCAKELGISESYFQHLYTALFGISFNKDLVQMRIENAKNILSMSDLSISQIASMCGYNNEVHFYRQFKDLTGITPAKYRKNIYNKYKGIPMESDKE